MDDFDKVSWFPTRVTELTRDGMNNPVMKALDALDDKQKENVMRKLERAIQEETITMNEDERDQFEQRWTKKGYHVLVLYQDSDYWQTETWFQLAQGFFKRKESAAEGLKNWFCLNRVQDYTEKEFTTENCHDMIDMRSGDKLCHTRWSVRKIRIRVRHCICPKVIAVEHITP